MTLFPFAFCVVLHCINEIQRISVWKEISATLVGKMYFMKIVNPLARLFLILSIFAFTKNNVVKSVQQNQDSVVAKGAVLKKVSDQFSFTEGASVNKQGDVFFTDQPNDKIWKYDT